MLTLIGGLVCVVCAILTVGYFTGNHRFRWRLKARANEVMTLAGNSVGDVVDDMNAAIEERGKANNDLMSNLATLKAQILGLQSQHKQAVANAEKYGRLAETAIQNGSDSDATKMLVYQSEQENKASQLLTGVEALEKTYSEVQQVLTNSMSEVEKANQEKSAFEARHASVAMREQMLSAVSSFGGQGNLDFGSISNELTQRESVLDARNQIAGQISGDDVVKRLEASVETETVKNRLEALKARHLQSNS